MINMKKFILFCALLLAFACPTSFARTCKTRTEVSNTVHHTFILLGASGDLSKREIYPALWHLFKDNELPKNTRILGHARHNLTNNDLRKNVEPFVKIQPHEEKLYNEFWKINDYIGSTGKEDVDYDRIGRFVDELEGGQQGNRVFFMALPPSAFFSAASQIKRACMSKTGWTRVIIEKPFGSDSESSEKLSNHLSKLFTEDQIYRNDHFLGYEMVRNLMTLRFANRLFTPAWNKENIASIEIDFKENFGVEGRGSYFDANGIIRDVMQNHLLQIMSLIAMERPKSANGNDIRDSKVKLLKETKPINVEDVVLGQYIANPKSEDPRERIGYRDDPTVSKDSIAATFAFTVLKVNNERWSGVPFIIRAGKGLNINQTEIIIQFKDVEENIFDDKLKRDKLIIRIGKNRELKAIITSKVPGLAQKMEEITIDYKYEGDSENYRIPEAYEVQLLHVFQGSQMNFVRTDELKEAWRIFTPILHEIEDRKIHPIEYKFGSTGPIEADEMEKKYNFV